MKPWEHIWVGLVMTVIGGVLIGAGLGMAGFGDLLGLVLTLGGVGLGLFGAVVSGIGVIAEGVRLGNHTSHAEQWPAPQVRD